MTDERCSLVLNASFGIIVTPSEKADEQMSISKFGRETQLCGLVVTSCDPNTCAIGRGG